MRILLLGAPGAGKGTQASLLADKYEIVHISTGDILRSSIASGSPIGKQAASYVDSGKLVPDSVMVAMIDERLNQEDAKEGFILDGFPRNLPQMEVLSETLGKRQEKITWAVHIFLDDDTLFKRLLSRAKEENRSDDTADVIKKRMQTFQEHTVPMISLLETKDTLLNVLNYVQIDGNQPREAVHQQINAAFAAHQRGASSNKECAKF